jgi:hypothetical protein
MPIPNLTELKVLVSGVSRPLMRGAIIAMLAQMVFYGSISFSPTRLCRGHDRTGSRDSLTSPPRGGICRKAGTPPTNTISVRRRFGRLPQKFSQ